MALDNNWIVDTVGDFIHSPIWAAPIQTFIEANCVTFDYDDNDDDTDEDGTGLSLADEQRTIYQQYIRLVDSLINGLGKDLSLDENELIRACQIPVPLDDSVLADESYEQLYSAKDFQLFQDMMKRKNLILQLQALVSLQLQWGLLRHGDSRDDLILSLLMQATSSSSRRGSLHSPSEPIKVPIIKQQSYEKEDKKYQNDNNDDDDDDDVVVVPRKPEPSSASSSSRKTKEQTEPRKPPKEEYRLPDLRRKGGADLDAEWHRDLQRKTSKENNYNDSIENDESNNASTPQTIGAIPENVLRQKLRDLTERTIPTEDNETTAAMKARQKFLKDIRQKIVDEKRAEREKELEQQTTNVRPQSAAHAARKAMATANETKQEEQKTQINDDELNKRRAMMAKLKREVVDKR
ncbi:unnamed protein product [Adineta steineri]|uniref:Cilia- and flagella-associated protein 36 n=1 Tax=Adineta steineri TaxID=433720 RepID=A0A814BQI7_9BILA|nr:unnamed protein product [Adineta steineri]CAF0929400.1 unnamed protein product [Adineta steineri]